MEDIRKLIQELSAQEARTFLFHIMLAVEGAQRDHTVRSNLYHDLVDMYEVISSQDRNLHVQQINPHCHHVHLAFGESSAGSLRHVMKKCGWDPSHQVITIRDHFAIGPVWDLHREQGRLNRADWLRNHINDGGDDMEDVEVQYKDLVQQISQIPAQARITIWSSSNAQEQVGLRYAMYLLRGLPNEVWIQDAPEVCAQLFDRPDARITYMHTGEISPDKLLTVIEANRGVLLSQDARSLLVEEWLEIANRPEVLRIYRADHIHHVSADYFDTFILEKVEHLHDQHGNHHFIKAARVVGEALGYCDQYVNDSYFEYRLRELVYQGELEILGIPRAMRYYSVRRKRSGPHDRERKSSTGLPLQREL